MMKQKRYGRLNTCLYLLIAFAVLMTPSEKILENVRTAVNEFVKDAEQFDDLTMLCLEYHSSGKDSGKNKR